jgi:CRP-like cAMP-binding protein
VPRDSAFDRHAPAPPRRWRVDSWGCGPEPRAREPRPRPAAPPVGPDARSLAGVELFAGLPADELARLAPLMRVRVVQPGQEIVHQDASDGGAVFFLLSGRAQETVVTDDGQLIRLAGLGAGAMFGEIAAIDGEPRPATVTALAVARVAVMPRASFLDAVAGSPPLALALVRALAQRSRRQSARLVELTTRSLSERVAAELVRLARPDAAGPGASIDPAPRQLDIANTVGARRESVARAFACLMRQGLMRRDGARLVIADRALLAERGGEPDRSSAA